MRMNSARRRGASYLSFSKKFSKTSKGTKQVSIKFCPDRKPSPPKFRRTSSGPSGMTASPFFLGLPCHLADGRLPRVVIFAAAHGSTYPGKDSSGYALAAHAIRAASQDDAPLVEHWDFDLGGPLFDGGPVSCIDAGDIQTNMHDNAGNRARIEAKTREVLELPAIPILLGGDC